MKHSERHKEKMADKKRDRAKRLGFAQRSESVMRQVQQFCEYWRGVRRKNGVGSRMVRETIRQSAAQP